MTSSITRGATSHLPVFDNLFSGQYFDFWFHSEKC